MNWKNSNTKLIVLLIISLVITGIYLVENVKRNQSREVDLIISTSEEVQDEFDLVYIFTAEQEQTALELIEQRAKIEYDQYDAGVFITSVNGKEADNDHYWAFYINDNYATQAADKTNLEPGDTVKLVYEEIDKTQFGE